MKTKINSKGICGPKGFVAAGIYSGIRKNKSKKDLALILSDVECKTSVLYTTNEVKAAPIHVTMDHLKDGRARGIIVNSGNANACAPKGMENAKKMASLVAEALNLKDRDFIVASTGIIGVELAIDKIGANIPKLVKSLSNQGGSDAAEAIMTTDTRKKEYALSFFLGEKEVTIGGISKGSGMIHPNMATTLNFLTSDVNIEEKALEKAWKYCVDRSFNRISVDGDTSTNDMASIMVNGLAENPEIKGDSAEYDDFVSVLLEVCVYLSKELVKDGEGASRLIACKVVNSKSEEKAASIAKSVISSSLVKAAASVGDANWGRVLCAAGYAGENFDPSLVDIYFTSIGGEIQVCAQGQGLDFNEEKAASVLLQEEVEIVIDLNEGKELATTWGCDLTCEYVNINSGYRT